MNELADLGDIFPACARCGAAIYRTEEGVWVHFEAAEPAADPDYTPPTKACVDSGGTWVDYTEDCLRP